MKWSATDNDDVIDARGSSGGDSSYSGGGAMRLGGGGLAAMVVVVVVARVFGIDLTGLLSGGGSSQASQHQSSTPQPKTGPDSDAKLVSFVKFVMKDVQTTFEGMFKAEGRPYPHAKLVLFSSAIDTGCGRSSSAIGPFYCPPDQKATDSKSSGSNGPTRCVIYIQTLRPTVDPTFPCARATDGIDHNVICQ